MANYSITCVNEQFGQHSQGQRKQIITSWWWCQIKRAIEGAIVFLKIFPESHNKLYPWVRYPRKLPISKSQHALHCVFIDRTEMSADKQM